MSKEKLTDMILSAMADGADMSFVDGGTEQDDHIAIALKAIEKELEAAGWDARATFYSIGAYRGALTVTTLDMPEAVYEHPTMFLQLLLPMLEQDPRGMKALRARLPENFFGIVFFSEGWSVKGVPDADMQEWAGRLDQHPDRVENRMGYACTLDGRILQILRDRGSEPKLDEVANVDGEPVAHQGSLIPLLVRLMRMSKNAAPSFTETKVQPPS